MEETKTEPQDVLPDTLHKLLELALKDYDVISKDNRYVITMTDWHYFTWKAKCAVCLAGCVMANHLNVPLQESVFPAELCRDDRITSDDYNKLLALDFLREGIVDDAFFLVTKKKVLPEELNEFRTFTVEPHYKNPIQWRSDMDSLLKMLKEHNL